MTEHHKLGGLNNPNLLSPSPVSRTPELDRGLKHHLRRLVLEIKVTAH